MNTLLTEPTIRKQAEFCCAIIASVEKRVHYITGVMSGTRKQGRGSPEKSREKALKELQLLAEMKTKYAGNPSILHQIFKDMMRIRGKERMRKMHEALPQGYDRKKLARSVGMKKTASNVFFVLEIWSILGNNSQELESIILERIRAKIG